MQENNEDNLIAKLNPAISKYVELRAYIKQKEANLKEQLKPFAEARDKLSAYLSATLLQNRIKRIGGEAGTAFNSDAVRYKVVDGRAYLQWLIDNNMWETAKIEPIPKETDAAASKAFEGWLERNKDTPTSEIAEFEHFLPPGVTRTVTTILKVRASGETDES